MFYVLQEQKGGSSLLYKQAVEGALRGIASQRDDNWAKT